MLSLRSCLCMAGVVVVFAVTAIAQDAHAASAHATRRATLRTFAGDWGGHGRTLTVTRHGKARETVDDGCCDHLITFRFQLRRVRGTPRRATAIARVTAVHVTDPSAFSDNWPAPYVGERRSVRLRNGIVLERFLHITFCDERQALRSACGA